MDPARVPSNSQPVNDFPKQVIPLGSAHQAEKVGDPLHRGAVMNEPNSQRLDFTSLQSGVVSRSIGVILPLHAGMPQSPRYLLNLRKLISSHRLHIDLEYFRLIPISFFL